MRRPSRTTRLRRKPCCVRRSQASRPCSRAQSSTCTRAALPRSEASRQSSSGTIWSKRPGRVEAAHERPVRRRAERVLELIAIAPLLDGRDDRLLLEALELPDPPQRLPDLLGLDLQLALVREHLPGRAGMVGAGRDAIGRRRHDLDRAGLGVRPLGLRHRRTDPVAGHGSGDEHDVAVEPRDAVAAVGESVHRELELGAAGGTGARGRAGHVTEGTRPAVSQPAQRGLGACAGAEGLSARDPRGAGRIRRLSASAEALAGAAVHRSRSSTLLVPARAWSPPRDRLAGIGALRRAGSSGELRSCVE